MMTIHAKSAAEKLDEMLMKEQLLYIYGDEYSDYYLLEDPESLPRYGHLARRALMHYVGDRYNPVEHGLEHEPFLRRMIKEFISYKIFYQTSAYDWEWIDNSFRKYLGGCFGLNLSYDQSRIDAGYQPHCRARELLNEKQVH